MTDDGMTRRTVQDYLDRARMRDRFQQVDVQAAKARLMQRLAARGTCPHHHRPPSLPAALLDWPPIWITPQDLGEGADGALNELLHGDVVDRARWDLTAVSLVVTRAPSAVSDLQAFIDDRDQKGALVFACLLFLVGRGEAARFWWQFAGIDDAAAAYLLFLDHTRQGEYCDATLWAGLLRGLKPDAQWGERRLTPSVPPIPPALSEDIGAHVVEADDPELGTIALPDPGLVEELRELTGR